MGEGSTMLFQKGLPDIPAAISEDGKSVLCGNPVCRQWGKPLAEIARMANGTFQIWLAPGYQRDAQSNIWINRGRSNRRSAAAYETRQRARNSDARLGPAHLQEIEKKYGAKTVADVVKMESKLSNRARREAKDGRRGCHMRAPKNSMLISQDEILKAPQRIDCGRCRRISIIKSTSIPAKKAEME
jgi:hypothetical protein